LTSGAEKLVTFPYDNVVALCLTHFAYKFTRSIPDISMLANCSVLQKLFKVWSNLRKNVIIWERENSAKKATAMRELMDPEKVTEDFIHLLFLLMKAIKESSIKVSSCWKCSTKKERGLHWRASFTEKYF